MNSWSVMSVIVQFVCWGLYVGMIRDCDVCVWRIVGCGCVFGKWEGYERKKQKIKMTAVLHTFVSVLLCLQCVSSVICTPQKDYFDEELLLKPLPSGHVYAYFQFTTLWDVEFEATSCKLSSCIRIVLKVVCVICYTPWSSTPGFLATCWPDTPSFLRSLIHVVFRF